MEPAQNLALQFDQERHRLRAVAAGILGSVHEADDAVQEAWFRLERVNLSEIANLSAWLTVVVSRIALDHVRARSNRREVPMESPDSFATSIEPSAESAVIYEEEVLEALNLALDRLSPLESATFILHDLFQLPFDEISNLVDKSPQATRKIGSRARQKLTSEVLPVRSRERAHHGVVEAFLRAAISGDLDGLIATLAPSIVLRADMATQQLGSQPELVGARDVAGQFAGRSQAARLVWIDGAPGAAWVHRGGIKVAFVFTINDTGEIEEISLRSDPEYLAETDFEIEPPRTSRSARE